AVLRQRRSNAQEGIEVQVGHRAVRGVGGAIAAVEKLPVAPPDGRALPPAESYSRLAHLAALLADVLAPRVAHAGKESVEIGVALVAPMKLHRPAQHHATFAQQLRFLLQRKEDVQRRGSARALERPGGKSPATLLVRGEKA